MTGPGRGGGTTRRSRRAGPGRPERVRLLAEYASPDALLEALDELGSVDDADLDVYSPYPVPGLDERLGIRRSRLPWLVLAAGVFGAVAAYLVQWYVSAVDYPLNVGGRPLHSAPAFVLITFEMTILFAAGAGFVGLLFRLGLPKPWNPLQDVPGFDRASVDRFFLAVEPAGPEFDVDALRRALERTGALRIVEVGAGAGADDEDERPAEEEP